MNFIGGADGCQPSLTGVKQNGFTSRVLKGELGLIVTLGPGTAAHLTVLKDVDRSAADGSVIGMVAVGLKAIRHDQRNYHYRSDLLAAVGVGVRRSAFTA